MNEEHWKNNVLADETQGALYAQLEADFDFNVVVLGDSKVGKTSLLQSYVNGGADLVRTRDSDGMYEMLNMHKSSPTREIWKHKVELHDGSQLPLTLHDTKSQSYKTSINQVFRDKHGFIIVCDITNLQSVRDVPDWLQQIERKADVVQGRQITVLVNKIETLIEDKS